MRNFAGEIIVNRHSSTSSMLYTSLTLILAPSVVNRHDVDASWLQWLRD
jgi:hypothetical protein